MPPTSKQVLVHSLRWDPRKIITLSGPVTWELVRDGFRDAAALLQGRTDALFLFYLSTAAETDAA